MDGALGQPRRQRFRSEHEADAATQEWTGRTEAVRATRPASASPARIPDTAANRAKLCKDLDHNIGLLSSDQPLTSGDASAPQQNMSDVQRRQELATARAQKQQSCQ